MSRLEIVRKLEEKRREVEELEAELENMSKFQFKDEDGAICHIEREDDGTFYLHGVNGLSTPSLISIIDIDVDKLIKILKDYKKEFGL